MRVIAGSAKGHALFAPPGLATRPTSMRAREALFSMLGGRVAGARFLDLFCGSGANGIEALSRGALSCVFVDSSRQCEAALRRNLGHTKLAGGASIMRMDFLDALKKLAAGPGPGFDVVFIDPPYSMGLAARAVDAIAAALPALLNHGALVAVEEASGTELPENPAFELIKQKRYGAARLGMYTVV